MKIFKELVNKLFGGHQRTALANKNVLYSFLFKGINIATQFALVPLMLHYLDASLYGIWLAISSILLWLSFFDLGVGNGLRVRLSKALAEDNLEMARTFISTAYATVTIVFILIMILFWIINPFINWSNFFNVSHQLSNQLSLTLLIVVSFACLQFITGLISNILFVKERMALFSAISPLSNLISLINIYILTKTTDPSLAKVAFYFSIVQPVIMFGLSLYLFKRPYKNISPSFAFVHFSYSKDLLGLGFKFLTIQFSTLMVYSFSNLVITRVFGPEQVTLYNLAYKYFTISVMVNGIICHTYWASLTQAYMDKDFLWVKNTVRKLEMITIALMAVTLLSIWLVDPVMVLWVGKEYKIPLAFKIAMSIAATVSLLSTPQNMMVNGTGKLQLQFLIAILSILLFIPLSLFFSKTLSIGPSGIILAMIITTLPTSLLVRIQYNKFINGNASGLWNR